MSPYPEHRLAIESGRWTKPTKTPLEERLCYQCSTLIDERHFVLKCPAHSELRCKYIHRYCRKRPIVSKCTEIITTDNKWILQKLACFVKNLCVAHWPIGLLQRKLSYLILYLILTILWLFVICIFRLLLSISRKIKILHKRPYS